ncbi:ATP-binding protein [Roseibium aggregatum]|uniref:AAA family ATPase n=1 Tax=Roseibium aggregatum TaxID=187304 RepID=A0A939J2F1_9HYPH|nr:ATP-binding protein [Roseibium aggregatum]MBN9669477.1 AAA family ATPase [Roseibium aggregatum]
MPKVVYLTGAPAAGKSSTIAELRKRRPDIEYWEYGARLTKYISSRENLKSQSELRNLSSMIVKAEDVDAVDDLLLQYVHKYRSSKPVIIDSHPVTKERYGYRITPFSLDRFAQLAPDEIWVFLASPEVTLSRIASNPEGRPQITAEEARFHSQLQASVAATYAMSIGRPVYIFDSSRDREEILGELEARL